MVVDSGIKVASTTREQGHPIAAKNLILFDTIPSDLQRLIDTQRLVSRN